MNIKKHTVVFFKFHFIYNNILEMPDIAIDFQAKQKLGPVNSHVRSYRHIFSPDIQIIWHLKYYQQLRGTSGANQRPPTY